MEVSQAPRCGTAIFNVSCAEAALAASRTEAAASRRETVFMTTTEIPLHQMERTGERVS